MTDSKKVVIPAPVFTRVNSGGYPWTIQLLEKNGFPIKDFGNDGLKRLFMRPLEMKEIKTEKQGAR
jgi:hypothetical protein